MLTVLTNIRSTKVLWLVENDLRWKITFSGRLPSVDPCMLPTRLCDILFIVDIVFLQGKLH